MPSLIHAQTSTHAKLSVFDGLIERAGVILPPVFLSTIGALGYLAYSSVGDVRTAYAVASASLVAALGLQVVIVPKNKAMQRTLRDGTASKDDGRDGNAMISEILYWNWGRIVLSFIALGAVLYAAEPGDVVDQADTSYAVMQGSEPLLAARKLEYGLE